MKRSENQALYKALPGQYLSYEFSPIEKKRFHVDNAVIKIAFWDTKEISEDEIYKPKIIAQVFSDLSDFADVASQNPTVVIDNPIWALTKDTSSRRAIFVQAKKNEKRFSSNTDKVQIFGHINSKMFYCQNCGRIDFIESDEDVGKMVCGCKGKRKKMAQYDRVWVCGCGNSFSIERPELREGDRYFANKPDGVSGMDGKRRTLQKKCPSCKQFMALENSTDAKTFYPRTITTIKLYNNNYAELCESEEGSQLIIDKHKQRITKNDFERRAEELLNSNHSIVPEESDEGDLIAKLLGGGLNGFGSSQVESRAVSKEVIYKVLEYDTLEERMVADVQGAIRKAEKLNLLLDKKKVADLVEKMKIKNIYSVSDIEIINTAYGYTRRFQSPENKADDGQLKLCAFTEKNNPGVPIFYNVKNKTEGIVIDIDVKKMYQFLKVVLADESINFGNLKEESEIKDWFLNDNRIDPNLIGRFGEIEDETQKGKMTKVVYTVLHTISHIAIQSISKLSGLSKDSLTEMVFPNLCSILIYAQTDQAVVLGAITSMFEKQIGDLLESIYDDMRICPFDPICMDTTNGGCLACVYSAETSCEHFNKDLSRRWIYGYCGNSRAIKGFWEEDKYGDNASE